MGRGGLETMLMNYYRHIDRSRVQFDFLVHRDFRADYDDEIESLGGKIFRLPRLVPWSRSYHRALDAFFDAHPEYKIIHVHQDCLSSVILKSAMQHGIPVRIAHSHSSRQDYNLKYPIKLFYRRLIPCYATKLFACGQAAGNWMFRGAASEIVPNAIDTDAFRFRPQVREAVRRDLQIAPETLVVGHVGRFSPAKNHGKLLEIFAAFHQKQPNSVLLLVGDGDLRKQIEAKISELQLQDSVILTGVRSDVADLQQAMDVFVFPSVYEGLPVTVIEAQTAGLPCIVSDTIPSEVYLTDLVAFEKLSSSADDWARTILKKKNTMRIDRHEEIAAHGFDISVEAVKLQEYYLNAYEQID